MKGGEKGKGPPTGGKGAVAGAASARLWKQKPFISDDVFSSFRDKFKVAFPSICWASGHVGLQAG